MSYIHIRKITPASNKKLEKRIYYRVGLLIGKHLYSPYVLQIVYKTGWQKARFVTYFADIPNTVRDTLGVLSTQHLITREFEWTPFYGCFRSVNKTKKFFGSGVYEEDVWRWDTGG